jgi:hypothetical protein
MIAWTSLFCSTRSMRAFSTLRILPRIGRIACVSGSRPPTALPPAESCGSLVLADRLARRDQLFLRRVSRRDRLPVSVVVRAGQRRRQAEAARFDRFLEHAP